MRRRSHERAVAFILPGNTVGAARHYGDAMSLQEKHRGCDGEIFRITPDRRVLIPGDIYEAAKAFWELVKQLAPEGWSLELKGEGEEPCPKS